MSSVLRELEELRSVIKPIRLFPMMLAPVVVPVANAGSMLESPKKTYTAFKPLPEMSKNVDRLGHAIEAAEEEMDAALRRTNDVHRNQLKQKEMELLEMQHALSAKERSIESMRDTLSTTRRTYESKQMQLETAVETRDAEIASLKEELRSVHGDLEVTKRQMQKRVNEQTRSNEELHHHQDELRRSLVSKSEEATHTLVSLREEREAHRVAQLDADDLRRKLGLLEGEVLLARRENQATKEHLELELEDANKRYRSEKSIRKACEKWLKAELKSRDEYDLLLTAIRDTASGGIGVAQYQLGADKHVSPSRVGMPPSARELLEVERLVHDMKAVSPTRGGASRRTLSPGRGWSSRRSVSPGRPGTSYSLADSEMAVQLADDNRHLKAELLTARKMIQDRLAR
eukprot:gene6433-3062_t